ncbi:MAG: sporulation initiation factor Spo0A C-terminal domain-containing protein [Lachnospiraceae bacterium]|nr:sporulation initiation factor Spo0A C-terminal domain-containing protein [Lachnospiraceae bacterium]
MKEIYQLILVLGIKRTYMGYHHLATAIQLVLEDESRLLYIHKWLYTDVARIHQTTPACIERNIRTVNLYCWNKGNRQLLNQIAGCPLKERPSNAEFIDILSCFLKDNSLVKIS